MGEVDRTKHAIAQRQKRKDLEAKRKAIELEYEKAACECFGGPSGRKMLFFLMDQCGYVEHSVDHNRMTGEINREITLYNEARRSLYIDLRRLLRSRPDILADVECNYKKGE